MRPRAPLGPTLCGAPPSAPGSGAPAGGRVQPVGAEGCQGCCQPEATPPPLHQLSQGGGAGELTSTSIEIRYSIEAPRPLVVPPHQRSPAMEGLSARVRATLAASGPDGADGLRRAVQRLGSCATGGAGSAPDAGGSSPAAAFRDRLLGGTLPPFEQFLHAGWSPPVLRSLEPQMMVRGRVVSVRPVGAVVLLLHAWPPGVLPSDSLAAEASPGAQTRPMDRTNARGVVQRAERNGAASEGAPAGLDLSRARVVALLHTSRVVPEGTLLADGCEVHPSP